ncbi:MAG: tetratricopeptide repeat protein [Woeseiaceae bacterium]|nr:tetratricopeptide repeat protein [Woeseiaceae bacterium]
MNGFTLPLFMRNVCLPLLAFLALPTASNAQSYGFKVVYAEVPGINEILAGDHAKAIKILEARSENSEKYYLADETATLCALYIVKNDFVQARRACDLAVERDRSHTAYNNRGVLRVHLGDPTGAIQDFDKARVQPQYQERYIEELKMRDARLIATSNYAVAQKLAVKRKQPWQSLASSIRGASIEDLN